VPAGTRAPDVAVSLAPNAHPAAPPTLRVALCGSPLVEGCLAHDVELPACGEAPDWELVDALSPATGAQPPCRAVRVTLRKAGAGLAPVVHWWARALEGAPAEDTAAFPDRARTAARAQQGRAALAEAEAAFRERAGRREAIAIDL